MNQEEAIAAMTKPKSTTRIPEYRQIYKLATGREWTDCFCGHGFDNIYNACLKYTSTLKK